MTDEAMKAMARRIADAAVENHAAAKGTHTWEIARDAALAAIIETTELAATDADLMRTKHSGPTGDAYSCGLWDQGVRIAGRLRNGDFLKGQP